MTDEIQLLRELGAEIPTADHGVIREIYERATRAERPPARIRSAKRSIGARNALVFALIAAGIGASLPLLLGSNRPSANRTTILRPSPSIDELGIPAVAVSDVTAADALLPFSVVLPSNATPTEMQVGDPKVIPTSGAWLSAQFETSADGSYQVYERATDATPATLQDWAQEAQNCSSCTARVEVVEGVHVLVVQSPVSGLQLFWVRGDGTSPVLTQLIWPGGASSEQVSLSIAGDMISRSG